MKITQKSIVLVRVNSEYFVLMTDKIGEPEKTKIEEIADRLDVFCEGLANKTTLELLDAFKTTIQNEMGIEVSMLGADMEININSIDFMAPQKDNHLSYMGNNWFKGEIDGYIVSAKVYSEPSKFGIDNGKVSKLLISDKDDKEIISYDRGWDKRPLYEHKEIYEKVLKVLEIQRLELNVKEQRNQTDHER